MDFDPLSFFEPDQNEHHIENEIDIEEEIPQNVNSAEKISGIENKKFEHDNIDKVNENESITQLLVLDLPVVFSNIPYLILTTILRLFKPDQVKNFGNNTNPSNLSELKSKSNDEITQILKSKSVTIDQLKSLSTFMNQNIDSLLTLTRLPKIDNSGLTAFLTKIIAYPFPNYSENERDSIYDLASHVMTANSAPALKGDTTRLVEINGLSNGILLYEPALTEDKIGNITWGASLELAKKIIQNSKSSIWLPNDPKLLETPILELGAGTGLVTIILGILGYKTISTDLPEIIDNLTKNIELNNLDCIKTTEDEKTIDNSALINITSLDWRSPNEFLNRTSSPFGFNIVILSDPVYSPSHPYWVRDAVESVLSKSTDSKLVFMVGRRDRFEDVRDCLWQLMINMGLKLIHSEIVNGWDDYGVLQYDYKVFGWNT